MLRELEGSLDLNRTFSWSNPSSPVNGCIAVVVHVYLSYPFILSWSLIEAMACGCCIVASKGMPVASNSGWLGRRFDFHE